MGTAILLFWCLLFTNETITGYAIAFLDKEKAKKVEKIYFSIGVITCILWSTFYYVTHSK